MNIKEITYSIHQQLQFVTDTPFKRSHIYELLASSYGFKSYSALCTESIFAKLSKSSKKPILYDEAIQERCLELGYSQVSDQISSQLLSYIFINELGLIKLTDVVNKLRSDSNLYAESDYEDENEVNIDFKVTPFLLENLESATSKNNALAHYALALIYKPEEYEPYGNQNEKNSGESYWYSQAQKGKVLTGVQKEWADAYAQYLNDEYKYNFHLQEAGHNGNEQALLELAEYFSEPTFFENVKEYTLDENPMRIAEIAENLGRLEDVKHWLTIAAEYGDIEAMHRLIEEYDNKDLQRCWVWLYLAKMMGKDLTQPNYHAIHEDGSLYEDDVGGPMYADGDDGINLPALDDTHDKLAKKEAEALFIKLQKPS